MRVLVLGSTGMLGVALCHQLRADGIDVVTLERSALDACNPDFRVVIDSGVDAVVNAIGMINRRLDRPEAEFLRTNSIFPRCLADVCQAHGMQLIHISTDCVFGGDRGPYDETSVATAADLYGMSKRWGEPANALVIRTSIIGAELNNHYSLMCWFLKQTGKVSGYRNHWWNGVTTLELSRAISLILRHKLYQVGVRHVYGEVVTKYQLLTMMQAAFGTPVEVVAVDDAHARDTRLSTRFGDFLANLEIAPMADQLRRLREVSDTRGFWSA